jgi:hypothetical protein
MADGRQALIRGCTGSNSSFYELLCHDKCQKMSLASGRCGFKLRPHAVIIFFFISLILAAVLTVKAENRIERITDAEAFRRLMPVLSIPWYDKEAISGIFSFVGDLISQIPSYLLYFTPGIEVAELVD